MTTKKSRFQEAFKEQYNVIGLAGAAALSAALLNPLPLLVGVAFEAAYLLFVPDSRWYESRLSRRFDAEVAARREALKAQVFPVISTGLQRRFTHLEAIRADIENQPSASQEHWFREVARKLDYLLEKFLLFARKDTEFRRYLQSVLDEGKGSATPGGRTAAASGPRPRTGRETVALAAAMGASAGTNDTAAAEDAPAAHDPEVARTVRALQTRYDTEMARIDAEQNAAEEDLNTRAVLQKRSDVLQQRRDYVGKIGRILTNLAHQMELLEDSFGLINDQLRAQSPEQVLADIEGVVYQTDSMTKLLEELAPYDIHV